MVTTTSGQESAISEPDSLIVVEQGFGGGNDSNVDYDAYVKELYGDTQQLKPKATEEKTATSMESNKREKRTGPAPGLFVNGRLNGMHIAINGASPFAVAEQLTSWYSYIDVGVTIKTAYEVYVEDIPIYTMFEVSTFSFENSYPQGGTFAGMAYIFEATRIGDNAAAVVGFGLWDGNLGSMLEANYRLRPTKNTFLRVGTRGVLISNVEPLGSAWWFELRVSMGLEL
ncbi:MAG: hypothetical protein K9N35_08250 [Candidatus Marinimicrobia bacterium]|nr:hypothetical protein [Candidatus Neomarinimicrobiota bacterium]